jgi:hypothetical protein
VKLNKIDAAFLRAYSDSLRAMLHQSVRYSTPEEVFYYRLERELTERSNEAEAWAYIERSLTHYARRGWR